MVDRLIAELARSQWGVVTRLQLLALGLSRDAIGRRVRCGRLYVLHRGVYAVGHTRLHPNGHFMAATLACGDRSLLSHRAAGHLTDLRRSTARIIDVTTPGHRTSRDGIRAHRPRRLEPEDATEIDGIPCTSVTRTIVDLASVLTTQQLAATLRQAERMRTLDAGAIRARLGSGVRGSAALRALLDTWRDDVDLRSAFEEALYALLVEHRLPLPRCNEPFAGYIPDFRWPRQRLIVETDGWKDHGTRARFEADRERDAHYLELHYRVLRITWRQLERSPHTAALRVIRLLDA